MQSITFTSTLTGLTIGTLVLCANFQFGLQTGWVSMMAMPAALLGFAWYKLLGQVFGIQDNVYVQSVAVAVGTGPLSFGLVGAIPALEKLITVHEGRTVLSVGQLMVWSFGINFIGIFIAKLLRYSIIEAQKLRFPSGSATAALIGVLHHKRLTQYEDGELELTQSDGAPEDLAKWYKHNIHLLNWSFLVSCVYTILGKTFPILRALPIFGKTAAKSMWVFEPSPAYIGQGVIMGLSTTGSMLLGAVLGWGVLAPFASWKGWATGPIEDWKTGGQGWIMWISLAIMIADSFVGLFALCYDIFKQYRNSGRYERVEAQQEESANYLEEKENRWWYINGLVVSCIVCVSITKILFPTVPLFALIIAVVLAPLLSLLGVRALGETDLNPVSSIAKLTQLLFSLILRTHPHAVLVSILCGAITEAGAQQGGDLMQSFKTSHLLHASNIDQFFGMLVGTCWSVVASSVVYKMYMGVYEIPGSVYRIPTAFIWADCARLVLGEGLPPKSAEFALLFGAIFTIVAIVKLKTKSPWVPSGVAVGIGMYSIPSFTLARFVGGIGVWVFETYFTLEKNDVSAIIGSSGLILGEGVMSVASLLWVMQAAK